MSKEITIQGLVVAVSQPFAEGHVVTEAEAKALNQVRAENIRNNCASRIKAALKEAKAEELSQLAPETIEDLKAQIAEYESSYTFTLASAGGGSRAVDPIDKEAKKVATSILKLAIDSAGKKVVKDEDVTDPSTQVSKTAFAEAVARYMEDPDVRRKAKKRLDEAQKEAESALKALAG